MFKSKERTGHQTLWSLSLPQNMFLQNTVWPPATDECESQSCWAHSKISSLIKVVWCGLSKTPLSEPRRKGSIFSRISCTLRHSVFLYAPTLILWTRSFRLKKPEPLFPVWLLCKMLLPLRLLGRVAFLITHSLGLCQPFKGFTFNYSSVPLSGHQGNASNNQGGSAADEDVSSQIPQQEGKKTHRNCSESHTVSKKWSLQDYPFTPPLQLASRS